MGSRRGVHPADPRGRGRVADVIPGRAFARPGNLIVAKLAKFPGSPLRCPCPGMTCSTQRSTRPRGGVDLAAGDADVPQILVGHPLQRRKGPAVAEFCLPFSGAEPGELFQSRAAFGAEKSARMRASKRAIMGHLWFVRCSKDSYALMVIVRRVCVIGMRLSHMCPASVIAKRRSRCSNPEIGGAGECGRGRLHRFVACASRIDGGRGQ